MLVLIGQGLIDDFFFIILSTKNEYKEQYSGTWLLFTSTYALSGNFCSKNGEEELLVYFGSVFICNITSKRVSLSNEIPQSFWLKSECV